MRSIFSERSSSCERLNRSSLFVAALSTRWQWVARGCHGNKCSLSLIRAVVFFYAENSFGPSDWPAHMVTFWCSVVLTYSLIIQCTTWSFPKVLRAACLMCWWLRFGSLLNRNPRLGVMSFGDNTVTLSEEHKLKYPLSSDPNNKVCEHCGAMLWIEETINC